MRARVIGCALGAVALGVSPVAGADQLTDPRTDYTAYTRPKGVFAVSLLKAEFGVIDEVTVGTYVPPWFAFPFLSVPIPSVYAKARSWWGGPFTLALRGGLVYIDAQAIAKLADDEADGSALSVAGELDASYRFDEKWSLSLGFDVNRISAVGSSGDTATSIEGASTADTFSTRLFGEWRLTRVFALTTRVSVLLYQSPYSVDSSGDTDAVSVDTDLSAESGLRQRRLSVVPGVSFSWERWELNAGVGYGVFYLPVLGIPTTKSWPIVDLGFAYRFDLY